MEKVRLNFRGLSEIVGNNDLGLLVLVDDANEYQITVTCDKDMLDQFSTRLQHLPVVGRLLPEVLWQALLSYTDQDAFELMFTNIIDGQYRVTLFNKTTSEHIAIRATDAILLSFISKIPIYIEARLMALQRTPFRENARGVAMPLNSLTRDMLDKALAKAVKDEDYETASFLRDEINRRLRTKHDSSEGATTQ